MSPHPLTNFQIQIYYGNWLKFNGFYARNNLSKIKDGAYIINLDEYESLELIGLLCMLMIIMWLTLIALELKILQKKLEIHRK